MSPFEQSGAAGGETVLTNARIVLRDEIVHGAVAIKDGLVSTIDPGSARGTDLEGDYLLPGLIDVHTDHLEKQALPRGGVFWNAMNAARTHDLIVCAAGTTTVFDSLVVGAVGNPDRLALLPHMIDGLNKARAANLLKADHLLHLRCDARQQDLMDHLAPYIDNEEVRFLTVMDDSPNRDPDRYRRNRVRKGANPEAVEIEIAEAAEKGSENEQDNRRRLVEICHARRLPLASHDDTLQWHIDESVAFGLTLSEFPISMEAARAAGSAGMGVVVGSPNIVAGRSHIGNASVRDLVAEGLVDVLSSDYVPASLLHAVWQLTRDPTGLPLHRAVEMATARPADIFGLKDRGEIVPGKRADLIRVREYNGQPVIMSVWVKGAKVFA